MTRHVAWSHRGLLVASCVAMVAAASVGSSPAAASSGEYVPGSCLSNAQPPPAPFDDLVDGAFYVEPVAWLHANAITQGVAPRRYGPDESVTRGQFATMLHRTACLPTPGAVAGFVDLRPGAYYRSAVDWLVAEGLTTGRTPTHFAPDEPLTRAEFATFLHRFVGSPTGSPSAPFVDVEADRFYTDAVGWLVERSVTQGTSATTFSPHRAITRGEIATFLYRLHTIGDVAVDLVTVATGLAAPTAGALDPSTGDLYITERAGTVKRVPADGNGRPLFTAMTTVADIGTAVLSGGEQGLLGVAVAPDGSKIYLSYTAAGSGDSVVTEYALVGGSVDEGSARTVITVDQPYPQYSNHNGGSIVFGPDALLYASFGDGGGSNDPFDNGQDIDTLLGAVLRIDPGPGPGPGYTVPADNPLVGVSGADEIFLYGVRNPWKFTFDSETGDLWIADVGQHAREEVTRLEASLGGGRGANLGWDIMEGTTGGPAPAGHVGPVHEYPNPSSGCSITGGYVYRGSDIPALDGVYIFTDFCRSTLRGWRDAYGIESVEFDVSVPGGLGAAFIEDARGELYAVSLGGRISRLERVVS